MYACCTSVQVHLATERMPGTLQEQANQGTSSKVSGNAKASGKKEQGQESQPQVDPRLYPGKEAIGIFRESLCCYIPTPV